MGGWESFSPTPFTIIDRFIPLNPYVSLSHYKGLAPGNFHHREKWDCFPVER